jgi:hypothetical protein
MDIVSPRQIVDYFPGLHQPATMVTRTWSNRTIKTLLQQVTTQTKTTVVIVDDTPTSSSHSSNALWAYHTSETLLKGTAGAYS